MSSSGKDGAVTNAPRCARDGCANPATKRGDTGPPRRYCSPACRQAAYRQRRGLQPPDTEVEDRDVIAEAVEHLNHAFAALPGPQKITRGGQRLMNLALELDQYHRGVLD